MSTVADRAALSGPCSTETCGVRFHVGLHVSDLDRAVAFYRILFGAEPAKHYPDYARFQLAQPPLVLALYPSPQEAGGALNHLGLRLPDSAALVEVQRRLEEAGIATQRQEGVECCYARQTKFWVTDPDRVLWEVYTLHEDVEHSGFDDPPVTAAPVPQNVWEHRLTDPWPERIPHPDGALDEVRLEGSFNARVEQARLDALLTEVARVLRPAGRLAVRALVSDRPFPGPPRLPGPASLVQHVPVESEPLDALRRAGFGGLFYEKLGDVHCFAVNGHELREMRLVGWKSAGSVWPSVLVVYKGPFAQVTDEDGITYRRGESVAVAWRQAERLRLGPAAGQFTFLAS
jgi:catechol 2,3-dioxygenase-like lactoylglutathione lyase family enzyme